uniref:Zgc:123107 n=1 Tax=Sinocyclocheilus rhinocerous TaxID=307959 RepID=A0A673J9F3_9TELE
NFLAFTSICLVTATCYAFSLCVFTEPPETSIYPRNDVQLAVENTLICHVTGFFPPPVNVSWTKNNVVVTEGVSLSQYRPRSDGTFHVFSSLKITPEERDIYSCTVNHRALQDRGTEEKWTHRRIFYSDIKPVHL